MKINYKLTLLLLLLLPLTGLCQAGKSGDGTYTFRIYATNDLHGRFFDSLYIPTASQWVHPASLASAVSVLNRARAEWGNDRVILLDVGDHLQGDNAVFYYNFVDTAATHIMPRVMNYLKYDAVVVGNHDIEPGQRVYDKVKRELHMPYLAANAIDTRSGEPYFEPYTILNKAGVKIAVIGLTNPNIPNWLSPDLYKNIKFTEIVPALEHWVEVVRSKEQPHFVIVAMHAGLGDIAANETENPARYVAENVKGIDLVFAAHDHQFTAEKLLNHGKELWLLEGGSRAAALSLVTLELTIKNNQTVSVKVQGETISLKGVQADSAYSRYFRPDFLKVRAFTSRPVGTLQNTISSRDALFGPSAYVDMIHALQLEASNADISFAAPLSFNTRIEKGTLNYQHLFDIYPFENQLNVIKMTGQEVKGYLEYSYSGWIDTHPRESGHLLGMAQDPKTGRMRLKNPAYNFDSAAGILYEVDINKPEGERIHIVSMADGTPFRPEDTYTVALTSYRASGGGYLLEKGAGISKQDLEKRVVARLADIREILYQQIQAKGYIKAEKLNQWQFVPGDIARPLAEKDKALLFAK